MPLPTHRDIRIFKGLDALSPWGNPTRYLQNARRQKDKHIGQLDKIDAIEALQAGRPVPGGSKEKMKCPLCQTQLSMKELRLGPFIWGADSMHYLTAHQIWPPELEELIRHVRGHAA